MPLKAHELGMMSLNAVFSLLRYGSEANSSVICYSFALSHVHHSVLQRALPRFFIAISGFKSSASRLKYLYFVLEHALAENGKSCRCLLPHPISADCRIHFCSQKAKIAIPDETCTCCEVSAVKLKAVIAAANEFVALAKAFQENLDQFKNELMIALITILSHIAHKQPNQSIYPFFAVVVLLKN